VKQKIIFNCRGFKYFFIFVKNDDTMIDRQKFNREFVDYYGNEMVIEVIDIFITDYPEHFRVMRKGLEEKMFKTLQGETHKIKGVIGHFRDPASIEQSK
jgi:hypothetical protein